MSIFRSEQIQQPVSLTGSLFGTASYANYAANATPFPYTGSAAISGSLIVNGVTQLTQVLTQSGSNAPVATTLINTTGKNFTWNYYNVGWYRLIANSLAFYEEKTVVSLSPGFREGTVNDGDYILWYEILDRVTLDIHIKKVGIGTGENTRLHQTGFDIRFFP